MAYAERFVRSIKESRLERMIFFGEESLPKWPHEFILYYRGERNRQELGNRLIVPEKPIVDGSGPILRREWLGGKLNYYYRLGTYANPTRPRLS